MGDLEEMKIDEQCVVTHKRKNKTKRSFNADKKYPQDQEMPKFLNSGLYEGNMH